MTNFHVAEIEINQIPDMDENNLNNNSWLCDPFGDGRVYGVKFEMNEEKFKWKFFFNEQTEDEAFQTGQCFLAYLKEIYPGLNGTISLRPLSTPATLNKSRKVFLELQLPPPPYTKEQIPLIQKIVNLYKNNAKHDIEIYILWQEAKSDMSLIGTLETQTQRKFNINFNYYLKIFIAAEPFTTPNLKRKLQLAELSGNVQYLTTEIKNLYGQNAVLKEAPLTTGEVIFEMKPGFTNPIPIERAVINKDTGNYIREKKAIDFGIPPDTPITIADIIHKPKLRFSPLPEDKSPRILIGHAYLDNVLSNKKAYLGLSDLVHHMMICGLSGVGKSRFLGHLNKQISIIAPRVGILVINLLKKDEEDLFEFDYYLKYGNDPFVTPYCFEEALKQEEEREKFFEILAQLLVSSVGLKNVVATNMENVLIAYYKKHNTLPRSLMELFTLLYKWFKDHPYHVKFQTNIMRAIRNRVVKLLSSPTLDKMTRLSHVIPMWLEEWKNGKNVFIDLSNCKLSTKRLLVNLIFQMIRIYMPEVKGDNLKNVIIIDEVSEILALPKTINADDDEYVTKFHLENVFCHFLTAFRSRGVALVLADQKPSRLFESVYSLPSVKILFRLSHSCSPIFTNSPVEQDAFALLPDREAIIIDGVNAKKYAFKTIDHYYKNLSKIKSDMREKSCLHCHVVVERYDKFCRMCGEQLKSILPKKRKVSEQKPSKIKEKTD